MVGKDTQIPLHLTHRQKNALLHIRRGKDVFVTGGAGTGKSAVLCEAERELTQAGKNVIIMAPTGIAALNVGGVTIHSFFGFPSGPCINFGGSTRQAYATERAPEALRLADTIIIDEISMVRADLMDAIISSIRKAERLSGRPKQLVVVGDFYQLPPVVRTDTGDAQLLKTYYGRPMDFAYAFQGREWQTIKFHTIILDTIVRQQDLSFVEALNGLRVGDREVLDYLNAHASISYDAVPGVISLYAYRDDAQRRNQQQLDALEGPVYSYPTSIHLIDGVSQQDLDRRLLDSLPDTGLQIGHVYWPDRCLSSLCQRYDWYCRAH